MPMKMRMASALANGLVSRNNYSFCSFRNYKATSFSKVHEFLNFLLVLNALMCGSTFPIFLREFFFCLQLDKKVRQQWAFRFASKFHYR